MFEGDITRYHCFNCPINASFDPAEDDQLSSNMQRVLRAYGFVEADWNHILFDQMVKGHNGASVKRAAAVRAVEHEPPVVELPSFFYPLTDDPSDEIGQYAIEYLKYERGIDWKDYPFMLAKPGNHPLNKRWMGRVIIPFYKGGNLIYYQGRDLTGKSNMKYRSQAESKSSVMYGYDNILSQTQDKSPLYITEGWFDAFPIGGVAVLGNTFTESQIYWLNRTNRQKIVVPDRRGKGYLLGLEALRRGWAISTPDIGDCKDINEAVVRFGLLYVLDALREHIYTDFDASVMLRIYCES